MKIKRTPIIFHNVISCTKTCKIEEWHQLAKELRNSIVSSGLYGTGPIIYQVSGLNLDVGEADYSFYIPVNAPVEMEKNEDYHFTETLKFTDGLLLRHADLDEDIEESYAVLRSCAESYQLTLEEPFTISIWTSTEMELLISLLRSLRRDSVVNPKDSIKYTSVVSRKYHFYYKDLEQHLSDFMSDVFQLKATIKGPLFYSINNIPLDEMLHAEFLFLSTRIIWT